MEEGKTVENQETRGPLRKQDSIRVLVELLEQQGMEQEKGDVIRMYRIARNYPPNFNYILKL